MSKSKTLTVALIVVLIVLGVAAWFLFGSTASGLSYPNAEKYSIGDASVSDTVNNLFIDWTAGKVTVEYYDGKEITVSETACVTVLVPVPGMIGNSGFTGSIGVGVGVGVGVERSITCSAEFSAVEK